MGFSSWDIGGCGCSCVVGFSVLCGTNEVEGAEVTVSRGGVTIVSGTTDASGAVALDVGTAGTYAVTATAAGDQGYSGSLDLACGGSETLQVCGGFDCGTCLVPERNLTLSWTNLITGDGSTTLTFNGVSGWSSACVNNLEFSLGCDASSVVFSITYFLSGACPDGQAAICSTRSGGLIEEGLTCGDDFLMTVSLTSSTCPQIAGSGYTGFTISS